MPLASVSLALDTIIGNLDLIKLWLDVGTELGYLYESLDGSNDGKLEGLFLGGSLGYPYSKFVGLMKA